MKRHSLFVAKTAILSISIFPVFAHAALFQSWEQSAMGAGMAHSDMAAGALDASTAYYNPAGMTLLEDQQISLGGVYVNEKAHLKNVETIVDGGVTGNPNVDSSFQTVEPNFHFVYPFENVLFEPRFGLSLVMPYREATYFNSAATNPYATKTSQKALLANPSLAFKLAEKLSIGAGIDMQQLRSRYGFENLGAVIEGVPAQVSMDGNISDWGTGWNIGLLYEWSEETRFGATYRSKITYHQEGDLHFDYAGAMPNETSKGFGEIATPASTTFGIFHDVNERLSLAFTAAYVQWSVIEDIVINSEVFSTAGGSNFDIPLELENSWFFAIGGDYKLNEQWMLRSGFSYDRTPVSDENREMRYPDADSYTFAAGLGYQVTPALQIEASYQFVYSPTVDFSNPNFAAFDGVLINPAGTIEGDAKRYANLLGLQLTWAFGGGEL